MRFPYLSVMAAILLVYGAARLMAQPAPAGPQASTPGAEGLPPARVAAPSTRPTPEVYKRLGDECEANLKTEILAHWFPAALDEKGGGFLQDFGTDWTPGRNASKAIVYESRLTWTAAQAAERFPAQKEMYTAAARHGLKFLAEKMWDQKNGGFYWSVNADGTPTAGRGGNAGNSKQEYGNGFGIYAAAAVYKLTKDPAALDLAKKGFEWYDEHGHDNANGGYFEILSEDGKPDLTGTPAVGGPPGSKSMNSSIHMLEALTSLYGIWPDPKVKTRLQEMFELNRDKIIADPGYLIQFFTLDWKPRPNEDSYGHDVETAYLLAEAADVLGIPNDPKTWEQGKKLVDHALKVGWDKQHGGLYNSGGVEGGNYAGSREWWVEAEWLNALLLMHEHYGKDNPQYWDTFIAQWEWINKYGIDKQNGGWWPRVNNNGTPMRGIKSDAWTECYHQGRAMLNVSARLFKLAQAK